MGLVRHPRSTASSSSSEVELLAHTANLVAIDLSIAFEQLQDIVSVARTTRVQLQGDEMRHVDDGQVVAGNARCGGSNRGLSRIVGNRPRIEEIHHLYRVKVLSGDVQDTPERVFRVRKE